MKHILIAGFGALACLGLPAKAASFVNVGDTYTAYLNGLVDAYFGGGTPVPGLSAELTLTFTGFVGDRANFNYSLVNTSSGIVTDSRISIFAFSSPDRTIVSGTTGGGEYTTVRLNDDFPNVGGIDRTFEVCFKTGGGPNCTGGGGGGTNYGETDTGAISLKLAAIASSITLDGFGIRWQSLDAPSLGINGGSGIGVEYTPSDVIPEPATWAMMIAGFGLVGAALRRRSSLARVSA